VATISIDNIFSDVSRLEWLKQLEKNVALTAGDLSADQLIVPAKDVQKILDKVVRLVLDLPRKSTPFVVWTQGDSELLIHSDKTKISISSGLVKIKITVSCDQCEQVQIPIPLGVSQRNSPGGLIMSSFSDLQGPADIVELWSDSLIAFAWELLLEITRVISAQVGKDERGLSLVPGNIGASPGKLLIQPVSRHSLLPGD